MGNPKRLATVQCRQPSLIIPLLFLALALVAPRLGSTQVTGSVKIDPTLPTLTTTKAAHSLTRDQAHRGYGVHLQGVVTYYDPDTDPAVGAFFVCDRTGCICVVVPPRPALPIRPGTRVDIQGGAVLGNYAPLVVATKVLALGQTSLPANPPRKTLAQLLTGEDDSQWIEVEAVVHSVEPSGNTVSVDLALADGVVHAITQREPGLDYARWVDAKVILRANAAPLWNKTGQMVGARLLFPSAAIKIVEPSAPDPFALPVRPMGSLLRF